MVHRLVDFTTDVSQFFYCNLFFKYFRVRTTIQFLKWGKINANPMASVMKPGIRRSTPAKYSRMASNNSSVGNRLFTNSDSSNVQREMSSVRINHRPNPPVAIQIKKILNKGIILPTWNRIHISIMGIIRKRKNSRQLKLSLCVLCSGCYLF